VIARAWSRRPAASITYRDARALVLPRAATPTQARHLYKAISRLYSWALAAEFPTVEHHPLVGRTLDLPALVSRERTLSTEELFALVSTARAISTTAPPRAYSSGGPTVAADFVLLALYTAARSTEIKRLRWADIEADLWTIPAADTKNKKAHIVPLTRQARAILVRRGLDDPARRACPIYVFAGTVAGAPVGSIRRSLASLYRAAGVTFARVGGTTAHDLRRTVASNLRANRFAAGDVVARVLNHTAPGPAATAVYMRYEMIDERRAALQSWADFLDAVGAPSAAFPRAVAS